MKKFILLGLLIVSQWAIGQANNPITNLVSCGENNIGTFDLNQATTQALNGYNPANFQVNFYLTMGDLNAGINPISNSNNFTNSVNPQTIYIKIVNLTTSEVIVKNFDLEVVNIPSVSSQNFQLCDFDNNGMEATQETLSYYNYYFSFNDSYEVKYYQTYTDAENLVNEIPQFDYYNVVGYGIHTLYVRVQKANTNCYSISTLLFALNDCASSGYATNLYGCLPYQCFDLSFNNDYIINTLNPINYQVAYFTSQSDAENNTNPIANATNYCVSNNQFLYARLTNLQTNAFETFPFELFLENCSTAYPDSFSETFCVEEGENVCIDLTNYNPEVIGNLNLSEYNITYHFTQEEANTGSNSIASSHCFAEGYYDIFSRIESNANPSVFYSSISNLDVRSYLYMSIHYLHQCDDDNNGIVVFDLASSESQIGYSNLTYYNNLDDAENQTNPITNPSNFTRGTLTYTFVFGRYNQANDCDYIYQIYLDATTNCINPFQCVEANSLCGALGTPFLNNQFSYYDEPNTDYGCLATHPNPTWFYLQASQNGTINLKIEQNTGINFNTQLLDVDYIVYGPFTNPTSGCANLTTANIVNCSYSAQSTEFPVIQNAQAGAYYLIMVTNFSNQLGYIKITDLNTTQSILDCAGIRMQAFVDTNNNAIKDANEVNFNLGKFEIEKNNSGTIQHVVAPNGSHTLYDTNAANTYDIAFAINPAHTPYYTVNPASYNNITINQTSGVQTYNFPVVSVQNYTDVSVTIVPFDAPRPGFYYQNNIIYTNNSNQPIASGSLTFNHDPNVSIFSVSQAGTTAITNGFSYNYTNLLPYETRVISVTLYVPTSVIAGLTLTNNATILPTTNDINTEDNVFAMNQTVINSYDPNDKLESHGGKIVHSTFTTNDYLYYTIRFENTGTASAVNIAITDQLDEQLNPDSFQVVSASHSYVANLTNSIVNFEFRNIQLPISDGISAAGKGYITFKIKPDAGYAIGDIIPNTAAIYFDFNAAIITNTHTTEFVQTLGNANFALNDLNYHPNPVKNNLLISNSATIDTIEITSVLGQQMLSQKVNSLQTEINLSHLANGIYFVKITSEGVEKTVKIVKE